MPFISKTQKFLIDHELSFLVFKGNYDDLLEKANVNTHLMVIKMDMEGEGEDLFIDAVRSFHNFLMSASTLIDHYRIIVQHKDFNDSFKKEYDEKIKTLFHDDVLFLCIKKLRNYTTHKTLPAVTMSDSKKKGKGFVLFLDIQDLKLWDSWNKAEKDYLDSLAKEIDVESFIEPYFQKTEEFYWWFMQKYIHYYPGDETQIRALFEKPTWYKPKKTP